MNCNYKTAVKLTFSSALNAAIDALRAEEFEVVSQIDLHDRFKANLGTEFGFYTILGAFDVSLAYRSVQADRLAGLMYPFSVVVMARDEHYSEVAAVLPDPLWMPCADTATAALMQEATERLRRVIDNLASAY